ncbi:MAG: type II/IV secretion system ATPase subunit [Candidatus Altiarchaeota archaeon]
MNARELTSVVPDAGGVDVHEMAALLGADVGDVKDMVEGLRRQWLFTVDGDRVFATDELRDDRLSGLLPRHVPALKRSQSAPLKEADDEPMQSGRIVACVAQKSFGSLARDVCEKQSPRGLRGGLRSSPEAVDNEELRSSCRTKGQRPLCRDLSIPSPPPFTTVSARHDAAIEKADGLCFKANPRRVLEYAAIWGFDDNWLMGHFNLTRSDLDPIVRHLGCEGLLDVSESRRLGVFRRVRASVPADVSTLIRRKYAASVSEELGSLTYKTELDVLADIILVFSPIGIEKAALCLNTTIEALLPVAETLHDAGIIRLRNRGRTSILEKMADPCTDSNLPIPCGTEKSTYVIAKDDLSLKAVLTEDGGDVRYWLGSPKFMEPTEAVMARIYEKADPGCKEADVKTSADFKDVKGRLRGSIASAVERQLPFVGEGARKAMVSEMCNEMHLGKLEYLLRDPNVEEIKAQGGKPVFIKHVGCVQEWVETNLVLDNDLLDRYAKAVARETAQQVDASHPLMDAVLHTGDRVNVCIPEAAGGSYVMEIRVFSKKPWNFVRLIRRGTVSAEVMAFLWLALQYRFNILVSGETGSGKTSFVNALSLFLQKNDHIVSVEDTREIQLPSFFRNWTKMTTKSGVHDGDVTMNRLLINALRMNPSFIIMGEVRGRLDIETLMRATSMGHPVMSTIHTRDCSTSIQRFEDAGVAACDLANIHLNVILEAVKSKGDRQPKRRVKEVGEYVLEAGKVAANRIYRLDMNTDALVQVNESRTYFQRVMEKVNMNKDEIRQDLDGKRRIVEWVLGQGIEDIETLGDLIQMYYRDPAKVVGAAVGNDDIKEVLEDGRSFKRSGAESH